MRGSDQRHAVLVIGCGSIGERHLRCFQQTARADVTACDTNTSLLEKMVGNYHVPTTTDWETSLNSGRHQAILICTPAPLHLPMAIKALQKGVHVLIEKPLSHSLQNVEELLQASRQSRAQAAVAYVFHVYPFLTKAREFIRSGELGPVRQAVMVSGQPFHRLRPAYAQTYYRDHRMGGGAIQDALTHSANWIESVLGPTDSLICDAAHQVIPGVEVEDTVHVSARNGGVLTSYAMNQFQSPKENAIQFNAERGSVRVEFHRQRWGVLRENDTAWTWHDLRVPDQDAHFIAQANAFLDQIEGQPTRLCTLEAAAQTLRFNLAALASAKADARVNCRDLHA
ncbi:MAG: Gfo/Idh/MocA family oxidoreductase [Bryobacteraceae bacterium]|nr:Gfo/Idh/MocA family oxidoreductase [Bryobacteraceae bacterium]